MAVQPPGLHFTQAMEEYSRGYLTAIAAAAACSVEITQVDDDGIDVTLKRRGQHRHVESPRLELQLKASSGMRIDGELVHYDLKVANYQRLISTQVLVPRLLVLLHMPAGVTDWIGYSQDHIRLSHRAYWHSLAGQPSTENAATISVSVPSSQLLDADTLVALMNRVKYGDGGLA
ncbi:MAG TPA: DUF4365 domain-containing protein [Candidatus Angelobacter sp.]|nr:DUF4365 domain-containing protein [Candidatus Angelobacter sp.]